MTKLEKLEKELSKALYELAIAKLEYEVWIEKVHKLTRLIEDMGGKPKAPVLSTLPTNSTSSQKAALLCKPQAKGTLD